MCRCRLVLLMFVLSMPGIAAAVGEQILSDSLEGDLECTVRTPSSVVVDVRSSLLQPVFLGNGLPFSTDVLQSARFYLVPREGQAIPLGFSYEQPADPIRVLNGVYDVEYRWLAGAQMPRNLAARVMQNVLVAGDRELVIDVPSAPLRGNLTMNGAPFPQAGGAAAVLTLSGIHGLGEVYLATSNESNYSTRLIPGAYWLRYQAPGTLGVIPANQDALRERHDIELDTALRNFDIPAVTTQFQFRIGNVPPPSTQTENGLISLRTKDGDRVDLGESIDQAVTASVIPGTYEGWWEGLTGSAVVPGNRDSRFDRTVDVPGGVVVLDVPVVQVTGDFLFGGVPAPQMAIESGRIRMRDRVSGIDTPIGNTAIGDFSYRLIPDAYDIVYTYVAGSAIVPANGMVAFERGRSVLAQPNADIDIPVATLAWNLTLDGGAFPADQVENGRIRVRSVDDDEDILMGDTRFLGNQGSTRLLVPGAYRAYYSRLAGAGQVPANQRATLDGVFTVAPGGGALQVIDVRVGGWEFTFSGNGVPYPVDPARRARFELRHLEDVVPIGATDNGAGVQLLVANPLPLADGRTGTVYYTWQAGTPAQMPRNIGDPVACYAFELP